MHQRSTRILTLIALVIGAIVFFAPIAQAQSNCVPFGGTIYGWLTNKWHGVGDFTVGEQIRHVKLDVDTLSVVDGGDIWTGNEVQTFHFGQGNVLKGSAAFVTEHMTDPGGSGSVFHINEEGIFTPGKGIFANVNGHWAMQGPFGSGVKLPDKIQPPPEASWFWIGQFNGTLGGMEN